MKDIKGMLRKNKKKALAFAVITAFSVSMASTFAACNSYDDDEDDDEQGNYSGSGGTYWHSFSSGSSGSKSSGSKISSGSKSSGYSGARGGFSS